jgi:hypothetical protein
MRLEPLPTQEILNLMDEFETATGENDATETEERTLFSSRFLPESFGGLMRRTVLLLFMGPGVLGILWIIGRILRR